MDRVIGKIFETSDYSKFKRITGNREVEKRAKKYMKSIQENGIISPIIVNELWEVIDGQARVQCGIELNIPIPYIIKPGLRLKEVLDVNQNTTKWRAKEIVHGYAENGDVGNKYLELLMKQFPQFELTTIYYAMTCRICNSKQIVEELHMYGCTAYEYDEAIKSLAYLAELNPYFANIAGTKRPAQTAVIWCYKHPDVDKSRLKDAIQKRCSSMQPMPNNLIAMEQIEKCYNWHRQNPLYLSLMYKAEVNETKRIIDRNRRC